MEEHISIILIYLYVGLVHFGVYTAGPAAVPFLEAPLKLLFPNTAQHILNFSRNLRIFFQYASFHLDLIFASSSNLKKENTGLSWFYLVGPTTQNVGLFLMVSQQTEEKSCIYPSYV
jgi:hypothetical protein